MIVGLLFFPLFIAVYGWALKSIFNMLIADHYPIAHANLLPMLGVSIVIKLITSYNRFESDEQRWYEARRTLITYTANKIMLIAFLPISVGIAWLLNLWLG
jgi:putative Mn2+ efflux pump MntP